MYSLKVLSSKMCNSPSDEDNSFWRHARAGKSRFLNVLGFHGF